MSREPKNDIMRKSTLKFRKQKLLATYCINNQLTFFIDVYTDAAVNYLARLHSHNYIEDFPILVLSEYKNCYGL